MCALWRTRKKQFDVTCCLHKMKQSHWLLCVVKSCDWSRKITPLSNLTWTASREMKTYSESKIELRNPQILKKKKSAKIKEVVSIRAALDLWAEKFGWCLEYCWSWKNTHEKLAGATNTDGHSIRVLNERSVSDGGNLHCVLWGWWFSNQFEIVSETPCSCNTVAVNCSELYFTRCSALKRTGTFASENKVTCLF